MQGTFGERQKTLMTRDFEKNQKNMKQEEFKPVPIKYFEHYKISTWGRLLNTETGYYYKKSQNRKNKMWSYKLVSSDQNKRKNRSFSVQYLIAITFVKNPNPKLYTIPLMKNGVFSDLDVDNIEWGSHAMGKVAMMKRDPTIMKRVHEARAKSIRFGNYVPPKKHTEEDVKRMLEFRAIGYSTHQLAEIFPIKKSQIGNIIRKHGDPLGLIMQQES